MKRSATTILSSIVLSLFFAVPVTAQQSSSIQSQDLMSFDEIRVLADAEVIITKSNRNHIKMIGDSTYIGNQPYSIKDNTLMFVYAEDGEKKLEKVVIEYKDINRLVTGGTGEFLIEGLEENELDIFNQSANLKLKGRIGNGRLYSQNGANDITDLRGLKITAYIGEDAVLKRPVIDEN